MSVHALEAVHFAAFALTLLPLVAHMGQEVGMGIEAGGRCAWLAQLSMFMFISSACTRGQDCPATAGLIAIDQLLMNHTGTKRDSEHELTGTWACQSSDVFELYFKQA